MDFQQPHRYMRPPPPPPPPSMADPHHQQPPRQPVPPPGPWFPGQFQYHHPPPPQHSPSPPPYHHWPPPDYIPPPSYPQQQQQLHNQYSHLPRPPPVPPHQAHPPPSHPHSQIPQSYHQQVNQDWSNPNWNQHQGWEYPVHNNEEDWAAKARAWAAANAGTDSQHPPSQFAPVGRQEEQNNFHDQYPQTGDPYYADVLQPPLPESNYPQYPAPAAASHRPPMGHPQESESVSSVQSSYILDGRQTYTGADGTLAGDPNAVFSRQESSHASPSVHQQEVPSSYSSVPGKEETGVQNRFYTSMALPIDSTHGQIGVQPPLPAASRSASVGRSHYTFGNQSAEPLTDLSDQPLHFAPGFNRQHDVHMQSNYTHTDPRGSARGVEPVTPMASAHTWTPAVAPGVMYPPIPSVFPSGSQHDPSLAVPSPVSGHPAFGRMPAPGFQHTVSSMGTPFSISTGTALHPATIFTGDVYGASSVSERPKKASVPNWLREEIIKKSASIATSAPEHLEEETHSTEDEGVDRSLRKGDLGDSKSIDSSKSADEEDDDEDFVEAAKTAAINQEIKRVLTEVLLKVTDELFDEIARKVLKEGDPSVEVDHGDLAINHKVSPSTPAVPTPKTSAKVLLPVKSKDTNSEDVSGKSTSSIPGDVLGLGSYASDDDEDDGIQSSSMPNIKEDTIHQQPSSKSSSEEIHGIKNGSLQAKSEEHNKGRLESDPSSRISNGATIHDDSLASDLTNRTSGMLADAKPQSVYSSKVVSGVGKDETNLDGEKNIDGSDASTLRDSGDVGIETEVPVKYVPAKNLVTEVSHVREAKHKMDKTIRGENKRSSSRKDTDKEVESSKVKTDEKGDEIHRRQDERHVRKGKTDDWNVTRERSKEQGVKSGDRVKEHDSRKRSSHPDDKDDRKESRRDKRNSAKEDGDREKRAKDEKGERSRRKHSSDSSRRKRHRSSSVASRGRNSNDNLVASDASISSDEVSDDSKRKVNSKRRNRSPSPVRSRKRQVSRSPHGKHTQRRHSPYSSLETNRGRRSRSRSPVRRQR